MATKEPKAEQKSKTEQKKEKIKQEKKSPAKDQEKKPIAEIVDYDPFTVISFALMSEKSIRFVEAQNKLVFIVDRKSTKKDVKNAVESAFGQHVKSVNMLIDQKARKKAFVTFVQPEAAGEIAIKLGII
ncbi:MAG: 50S ribosomal protein L23 [Candidatus Aenigmarchaeota archaeon]|nr:50S ribosomal protein L23 [Candidatus Aenigmarchaeota archaeon]